MTAWDDSSGPYSLQKLADMDHPYAKRHGTPQLDPSIINLQTGRFRSSWATEAVIWTGGYSVARLINDNPVADKLRLGTQFMFARPVDVRVATETEKPRLSYLDAAMKHVLRKF